MGFRPMGAAIIAAWLAPKGVFAEPEAVPRFDPTAADYAPAANSGALMDEAFFLKLGFSFVVGLAVGFALKVAFKIALVVLGLILAGIFALQYADLVDVNWSGIEGHYDTWAGWLGARGSVFLDFMGENLSSSASFLAGLALGLRL